MKIILFHPLHAVVHIPFPLYSCISVLVFRIYIFMINNVCSKGLLHNKIIFPFLYSFTSPLKISLSFYCTLFRYPPQLLINQSSESLLISLSLTFYFCHYSSLHVDIYLFCILCHYLMFFCFLRK